MSELTSVLTGDIAPENIISSQDIIEPCYQDLVSFTLDHDNYDETEKILIDVEDPSRGVTLAEARLWVSQLMDAMAAQGVAKDDTVCIVAFNDVMYPLMFLAIVGLGARITAANPAYTAKELTHHFSISNTAFVITTEDNLERVEQAIGSVVRPSACSPKLIDIPSQLQMPAEQRERKKFNDRNTAMNTIALLASTSGTTGLPKMAARSHYSLVMENLAIEDTAKKPYEVKRLLCTPFFHGFTMPLAVISALRLGLPTYVMRRFDQFKFLHYVQVHSITETAMPPPMIIRFLALDDKIKKPLKCIRLVWSGGAPMSAATQTRACGMLADTARICQVWGMTEGGWFTTFHYPETDNSGSVGRLVGTYEATIVPTASEHDSQLGPNELGEIWLRGPINMMGYFKNAEATQNTFVRGGWLRTGDLGYAEGHRFFVRDRIKDLIKVRGWQVPPAELEARLLEHPDIIDAGVVGSKLSQEDGPEIPYAFIVVRPQRYLTHQSVKNHLLGGLTRYKVDECVVRFLESLPKSASGKILKTVLKVIADTDIAGGHGRGPGEQPATLGAQGPTVHGSGMQH